MPRTITARLLVAYAAGVVAVFNLLGAVNLLHPSMLLFVGAVCVSLPPIRRRVERYSGYAVTTPAAIVVYLACTVIGNVWIVAAVFGP